MSAWLMRSSGGQVWTLTQSASGSKEEEMKNQAPQTTTAFHRWAWTPMLTSRRRSTGDTGAEERRPQEETVERRPQEETVERRMETEARESETEEVDASQKYRIRVRAFRHVPRKIHSDRG